MGRPRKDQVLEELQSEVVAEDDNVGNKVEDVPELKFDGMAFTIIPDPQTGMSVAVRIPISFNDPNIQRLHNPDVKGVAIEQLKITIQKELFTSN